MAAIIIEYYCFTCVQFEPFLQIFISNKLLKLIINKVKYARMNERIEIVSPLEGYMEVEQCNFIDLFIEPKMKESHDLGHPFTL
ncbi:hypothetical protein B2I20_18900 [Bacillus stratosphericus]|nr:hypothetical protein B2I20_18900 [Bacillus stratosphericus]TFW48191.1 hypothetical protein ES896_07665 [Bacillus sp. 005/A4HT-01/001]